MADEGVTIYPQNIIDTYIHRGYSLNDRFNYITMSVYHFLKVLICAHPSTDRVTSEMWHILVFLIQGEMRPLSFKMNCAMTEIRESQIHPRQRQEVRRSPSTSENEDENSKAIE